MDKRGIGKRIRASRKKKSLSQEKLAELVGISTGYMGVVERGEKLPKLETFIRMLNLLEVSADEILVDVLDNGYKIRLSQYADQIEQLDERERRRIYNIVEAYLDS